MVKVPPKEKAIKATAVKKVKVVIGTTVSSTMATSDKHWSKVMRRMRGSLSESTPISRRPAILAMATTETAPAASAADILSKAVPRFEATPMMYRPTMQSIKNIKLKSQ